MNYDLMDFEMDDWDDEDEDEILYESEEFREQALPAERANEPIISDDLPVLPLRGVVIYPMMWLPLPIGQERSIRLVENTLPNNRIIALVTSKNEEIDEPAPNEIHTIGTAAQVHRVLKPGAPFVVAMIHPVAAMFGSETHPRYAYGAATATFADLYMMFERSNFHLDQIHELNDRRVREPLTPSVLVLRARKQGV